MEITSIELEGELNVTSKRSPYARPFITPVESNGMPGKTLDLVDMLTAFDGKLIKITISEKES